MTDAGKLAETRHDPHCEWHWFGRCNCSEAFENARIIRDVTEAFQRDLDRLTGRNVNG